MERESSAPQTLVNFSFSFFLSFFLSFRFVSFRVSFLLFPSIPALSLAPLPPIPSRNTQRFRSFRPSSPVVLPFSPVRARVCVRACLCPPCLSLACSHFHPVLNASSVFLYRRFWNFIFCFSLPSLHPPRSHFVFPASFLTPPRRRSSLRTRLRAPLQSLATRPDRTLRFHRLPSPSPFLSPSRSLASSLAS